MGNTMKSATLIVIKIWLRIGCVLLLKDATKC
jgi:hypothetical protein